MNDDVKRELEIIRKRAGGVLYPKDVVEFARNKNTALHERFDWDDSSAAEKYRLEQARSIIRVVVDILPNTRQEQQFYVSLSSDRVGEGGYRSVVEVLSSESHTEQMLADAKKELRAFTQKYETLVSIAEMREVITAIRKVTDVEPPVAAKAKRKVKSA